MRHYLSPNDIYFKLLYEFYFLSCYYHLLICGIDVAVNIFHKDIVNIDSRDESASVKIGAIPLHLVTIVCQVIVLQFINEPSRNVINFYRHVERHAMLVTSERETCLVAERIRRIHDIRQRHVIIISINVYTD